MTAIGSGECIRIIEKVMEYFWRLAQGIGLGLVLQMCCKSYPNYLIFPSELYAQ